jgi:murein DD-endopeptidase MepM/ murein hydrolase activator NlpD
MPGRFRRHGTADSPAPVVARGLDAAGTSRYLEAGPPRGRLQRSDMSGSQGRSVAALTAVGVIVFTGCTATTPTPAPTAVEAPVEAAVVDEFSPLVISMVEPGPIPVRGTDGLYHLVYELQVQNASPRAASLVSIVSSADGAVIDETAGEELLARMLPIGDYPFPPRPISQIAPGTSALVLMDTTFEDRDSVPEALDQAISATFGAVRADQANFAELFPTDVVALASTPVTQSDPILIGPPLTGPNWVAVNGCCRLSPHRGAMIPIGGRINASERYAVDWARLDLTDIQAGENLQSFSGDPGDNADYFTYDQPVLAVADGEVAVVSDGFPDMTPNVQQDDLPLKDYGGNYVVLKISESVYAFYAHLKSGSMKVDVGDRVQLGDEIGRTGNSGNTSEAHLHFHVMDGISPLTAGNLPFEITAFSMVGAVSPDSSEFVIDEGERANELPLGGSGISFPDEPR